MSNFKPKRPSSARRNIKQELFSQSASLSRLRTIQNHLVSSKNNADVETHQPDAILCILGIDGRYNDGTRELVNYLLFGFFDVRKNELERSGFPEETIDDMMFVIRGHSVDVYCNPVNFHYLLPYVAHWRNLHVHCLSEEQYEDDEKAEEFKIQSFLSMVDGCHCVGIPFCSSGQQIDFDTMAIEKWPIVQAYALEGIGGGGFFTMKYKVMDISAKLHDVYHFVDPVAFEALVTEQLPLLERQWASMLTLCEQRSPKSEKSHHLMEGRICEPLSSYFSHGRVVSAKGGRSIPVRHPFVLFGSHTCKADLENAYKAGISYNSDPMETGINGLPAHHMICQAVSPRGPLCATRTYFFDTPITPIPMSGSITNLRTPTHKLTDARLLQQLYLALMEAVLVAMNMYSMTLSSLQAEKLAVEHLQKTCQKAQIPVNSNLFTNDSTDFHLAAFDNQNRKVPLKEGVSVRYVKTLGLTIYDIPSLEHAGHILGSISFTESFLESSINVLYPDESLSRDGNCVNLTSCLPRYITWPVNSESRKIVTNLELDLKADEPSKFGSKLLDSHSAHVVTEGVANAIYRSVKLHIYEQGIVFMHEHIGTVVLPKQETSAVYFYDGDSPSVPAILIVCYKEHVRHYLPLQLRSDEYRLNIVLQPRTKAYKTFFSNVLPHWRDEEEKPSLEMLTELPPEIQEIHRQFEEEHKVATMLPSSGSHLQLAKSKMPDLSQFLKHFVVSSVGSVPISSKHIQAVLDRPYDAGSFNDTSEMLVMILCGVPGCHKDSLCTKLTSLAKDENRWTVLKPTIANTEEFSGEVLQKALSATWKAQLKRKPGQSHKKLKALIVTPGYTDVVDVVQALVSHPDPEIVAHIRIGAVTVCVDHTNAFMENTFTLPKLLDQCSQGWVNNIIFTGPNTPDQSSELQSLQQLLRATNSDVAFLVAPHGEVSRSTDIDLILSEMAFNMSALVRARYLSCPGWWLGQFDSGDIYPSMEEEQLSFHAPLDKKRLLNKLKTLKTSHKEFPFSGNVYYLKGKVQFSDSDQVYDLKYAVLSGSLSLTVAELLPSPPPVRQNGQSSPAPSGMNGHAPSACFLMFIGCCLDTTRLREWSRGCVKPKPEPRVQRSRESLTRMEINRVHKEHHLEGLPDGWFYNGTQFVSLAGDRTDTHPKLEQFLDEYVDKVNREAKQYNAHLQQLDYHDLFEE